MISQANNYTILIVKGLWEKGHHFAYFNSFKDVISCGSRELGIAIDLQLIEETTLGHEACASFGLTSFGRMWYDEYINRNVYDFFKRDFYLASLERAKLDYKILQEKNKDVPFPIDLMFKMIRECENHGLDISPEQKEKMWRLFSEDFVRYRDMDFYELKAKVLD